MAKPRVGNQRADLMGLVAQAIGAMGLMGPEDGLKKMATNSRYGPNPYGLSGLPLVQYWSSLDANTPDKMTLGRSDELYGQYAGSPYAKWLESIGAAPGMGGRAKRSALYNAALGKRDWGGGSPWYANPLDPGGLLGELF